MFSCLWKLKNTIRQISLKHKLSFEENAFTKIPVKNFAIKNPRHFRHLIPCNFCNTLTYITFKRISGSHQYVNKHHRRNHPRKLPRMHESFFFSTQTNIFPPTSSSSSPLYKYYFLIPEVINLRKSPESKWKTSFVIRLMTLLGCNNYSFSKCNFISIQHLERILQKTLNVFFVPNITMVV